MPTYRFSTPAYSATTSAPSPVPKSSLPLDDQSAIQAKTAVLYGDSGLGKSTQLMHAALALYREHNHPIRLISAEDSSKEIFEPLIAAGIVQPYFLTKVSEPVPTLRRLSRGDWPKKELACAYIIEGITSIAEQIQEDCRDKGRFLGEQKEQSVREGGENLALPGKFSYNFTQLEMIRLLRAFSMLPVERIFWSAHETKGAEEGAGIIRGPAIVGTAKTASIQKYCGLLLHIDGYSSLSGPKGAEIVETKRRVWFVRHPDPLMPGIEYPAKTTLPPAGLTKLREFYPGGYFDSKLADGKLDNSLATFLAHEQLARDVAAAEVSKFLESNLKET